MIGNPALRDRNFQLLCGGSACNNVGMSGELVVIGIMTFDATGSSAWVGIALALYHLPMLVFGLLTGVIADWMDRRDLLRRVELATAVNLVAFAVLMAVTPASLWLILLFAFVAGSVRDLAYPARISYAYDLVGGRNIVAGLGLLNLVTRFGQLFGALVGGAVMQNFGAPATLMLLAAAHVLAFALMARLRPAGKTEPAECIPVGQSLRESIVEMRTNAVLLALILVTGVVEVFGFSYSTALPEMASARFDSGAEGLGEMHGARAIGGIIAGLALVTLVSQQRRGRLYLMVICGFGVGLLGLSAVDEFLPALAMIVVVAAMATSSDVLTQSMMQLSVPDRLRGRAMGCWVFAIGWAPFGHLEMGSLAAWLGVSGALSVNGCALIAVGILVAVSVPRLRKL